MFTRLYRCQILEVRPLNGDITIVRFKPQIEFKFRPGQFLSLEIPDRDDPELKHWRAYSHALPPELSRRNGYELCIRLVPGGQAGSYIPTLKRGDWIRVRASYGEFTLKTKPERAVCLIGTGTGVAPLRSIALSREFQDRGLAFALAILGYRTREEVPFLGDFEKAGVATTYALSREKGHLRFPFFSGRVTDVLKNLKPDFPWQGVDYYLCGNSEMIDEVQSFLKNVKGVDGSNIIAEAFTPTSARVLKSA